MSRIVRRAAVVCSLLATCPALSSQYVQLLLGRFQQGRGFWLGQVEYKTPLEREPDPGELLSGQVEPDPDVTNDPATGESAEQVPVKHRWRSMFETHYDEKLLWWTFPAAESRGRAVRISQPTQTKGLALVLWSNHDPNGAFSASTRNDIAFLAELTFTHRRVVFERANDVPHLLRLIETVPAKYHLPKISTLVIGGHGSRTFLDLAQSQKPVPGVTALSTGDEALHQAEKSIDKDANVILMGCSTGAVDDEEVFRPNLADHVATVLPGRLVTGVIENTPPPRMEYRRPGRLHIVTQHGRPLAYHARSESRSAKELRALEIPNEFIDPSGLVIEPVIWSPDTRTWVKIDPVNEVQSVRSLSRLATEIETWLRIAPELYSAKARHELRRYADQAYREVHGKSDSEEVIARTVRGAPVYGLSSVLRLMVTLQLR